MSNPLQNSLQAAAAKVALHFDPVLSTKNLIAGIKVSPERWFTSVDIADITGWPVEKVSVILSSLFHSQQVRRQQYFGPQKRIRYEYAYLKPGTRACDPIKPAVRYVRWESITPTSLLKYLETHPETVWRQRPQTDTDGSTIFELAIIYSTAEEALQRCIEAGTLEELPHE